MYHYQNQVYSFPVIWEMSNFPSISLTTIFPLRISKKKSRIFSDHLGIENSVRMFTGQTAAEDCIKWTAFKSREAIEEAAKRVQPYENGYRQYLKALRGE